MSLTIGNDKVEDAVDELQQSMWSVISFDRLEAANLTYNEALRKVEELENKRVVGLCIVTDRAAARTHKA